MAKLWFKYGAMGSSKTIQAITTAYNYNEKGKNALLVKPKIENRDGERIIKSRIGLAAECVFIEELCEMSNEQLRKYDCIVVDEVQFASKEQIRFMVHIVDDIEIPVICFGLRTDFKHELWEGSKWLMAWADVIEELKSVCWCGDGASCNTRINEKGEIVKDGELVKLGGNDSYIPLCRKHYDMGITHNPRLDE